MKETLRFRSLLMVAALVLVGTDAALGYVGPAGIGALGVLLVVVAVLLIGAVGLLLHPIRLVLRRRRRLREERDYAARESVAPPTHESST